MKILHARKWGSSHQVALDSGWCFGLYYISTTVSKSIRWANWTVAIQFQFLKILLYRIVHSTFYNAIHRRQLPLHKTNLWLIKKNLKLEKWSLLWLKIYRFKNRSMVQRVQILRSLENLASCSFDLWMNNKELPHFSTSLCTSYKLSIVCLQQKLRLLRKLLKYKWIRKLAMWVIVNWSNHWNFGAQNSDQYGQSFALKRK